MPLRIVLVRQCSATLRCNTSNVTIADSERARIAQAADLVAAKRTGTWPVLRYSVMLPLRYGVGVG
jgi:hypothetical protein